MRKFLAVFAILLLSCSVYADIIYEKVKNDGTAVSDWSGTYLIVREVGDSVAHVFNGALDELHMDDKSTANGNSILNIPIRVQSNGTKYLQQNAQLDAAVFKIVHSTEPDLTEYYGILSGSGYYIGHKDTADNGLSVEKELKTKCHNSVSFESSESSKVVLQAYSKSGTNNFALRFNDEQNRFRYYAWDEIQGEYKKKAIWLYRRTETQGLTDSGVAGMAVKRFVNGKITIVRGGKMYDMTGICLE